MRKALDAVLAGKAFRDSPQLRAFLSFVVEETLAGRGSEIKGYSIATLALGRPDDFDPQTDPIVRVQAGRLRQALAEHYAENAGSELIIALERGTYTPTFTCRTNPESPDATAAAPRARAPIDPAGPPRRASDASTTEAQATKPPRRSVLAVALGGLVIGLAGVAWMIVRPASWGTTGSPHFEPNYPEVTVEADPNARYADATVMAARLRDAVSRFDDLVRVGDEAAAKTVSNPVLGRGSHLLLRISGNPADAGQIRLSARLLDRYDQRLIWSREFEPFVTGADNDGARSAFVRSVASTIAQPYGVIHAYVRSLGNDPVRGTDPFGCLVAGFDYWQTNDEKNHLVARDCIVDRLRGRPNIGALHAQLAYLHLEEYRHGYNALSGDPLSRALESAQTAVRLAPASARSHQALLAVRFSRRDMEGAWLSAGEALRLNPFDTDILADIGARHVQSGRYEKGLQMLLEALAQNPAPPVWASTYQAIALYMLDQLDRAGAVADQLEATRFPAAMAATFLVAFQQRDAPKARRRLDLFRSTHPTIALDLASYLGRLNVAPEMLDKVMESYRNAIAWTEQKAARP